MFGFLKKVTDPVCKMKIDKTKYFSEHEGTKYYFCSESCKSQFNTNPKDYIKENASSSCCRQ